MKIQSMIFNDIPKWIIIIMPVLLITGPFLPDLGVSLIAILFIINSIKNKLYKNYNNIFFKVFLIFCLLIVISSLLSNNIILSLKTSLFYFRFGIFSLCFWYLVEKNNNILKHFFLSILACFFCLIIDGYTQYITGKNLFGYEIYDNLRVSSFFGDELILGSYLARLFPILFGLYIFLDNKKIISKKFLFLITIIFIFSEGLIFLSGERLALFFMNLSAIFIILMIKKYRTYRMWTYFMSIFLIIMLLVFLPQSKQKNH